MQILSHTNVLDLGWLIFLIVILIYFWHCRHKIVKTKKWFIVEGRIVHCEWLMGDHRFWPKIEYVYHVDGRDYTNENLVLDTKHLDPSSQYARMLAYNIAIAYQQNTLIKVYYNPTNPAEAVLNTTIPRKLNFILMFIAGLIMLHLIIVGVRLFKA